MTASHGDLPDINVWLALSAPYHRHHAAAQAYWHGEAASRIWFCRHSMLGLVRLLCQKTVMAPAPAHSSDQAWQAWQSLRSLPEVGLLPEPEAVDAQLADFVARCAPWPTALWPDAYLAAFAAAANLRLVSFDRDFSRFPGLNWLHLTPETAP